MSAIEKAKQYLKTMGVEVEVDNDGTFFFACQFEGSEVIPRAIDLEDLIQEILEENNG